MVGRVGLYNGSNPKRSGKRKKKKVITMPELLEMPKDNEEDEGSKARDDIPMTKVVKEAIFDDDKFNDTSDDLEMAVKGYNLLYPEVKPASIRPLSFARGGGILDINMREQIDTPRGDTTIDENIEISDSTLMDEYKKYRFQMLEQGHEPMSLEQFRDQAIAEGKMASGDMNMPIEDIAEEFFSIYNRKPRSLEELKEFYFKRYVNTADAGNNGVGIMASAAEGGRIGYSEGSRRS